MLGIHEILSQAAQKMADSIEEGSKRAFPVNRPLPPKALEELISTVEPQEAGSPERLLELFRLILDHSPRINHPLFLNQLCGRTEISAVLGEKAAAVSDALRMALDNSLAMVNYAMLGETLLLRPVFSNFSLTEEDADAFLDRVISQGRRLEESKRFHT